MMRNLVASLAVAAVLAGSAQAQETVQPQAQQQSLGEIARALKAKKQPEVVINQDDAEKLFSEVDSILRFASETSELPKHTSVKYKLLGRDEIDQRISSALSTDDSTKRIQHSELVLKKFGLLPDDFKMQQYLTNKGGSDLAGFYDFRDKTMYLLNWIPLDQQRPVMAHELTHALQDQNYDLEKWRNPKAEESEQSSEDGMESTARLAATEGQAMLVYLDYELRSTGVKLSQATDRFEVLKSRILSAYDSPDNMHTAPLIFKEVARFPYYDGFTFELEVLKRAGTRAAFAGVFARPPRDTHEILQPEAYLAETRPAPFSLPNLMPALGFGYKAYDSGSIGELDVRIMAKQFGRDNDAYAISPYWSGGAYLAVRKPTAESKPENSLVPSDLALMYVSRWKTAAAAERFAELYKSAILKRSTLFDAAAAKGSQCGTNTPDCTARWRARFDTDEGPVVMELSQDNTLMITQGLEDSAVQQVKLALARDGGATRASNEPELSLRFMNAPAVQAMREDIAKEIATRLGGK